MTEDTWINDRIDPRQAASVVAGLDSGAESSRVVILSDGQPCAFSRVKTGKPRESALKAIDTALAGSGLNVDDISFTVATGRGRKQVPFAHKTVSEIACAAAGAVRIWGPSVRTVLDLGAQSCRVIHCTGRGRIVSFLWNDKCAAGIGRSLQTFAGIVGKKMTEIGDMALQSDHFPRLGDFCAVYAQSEALDLIRNSVSAEQAVAAFHYAMARRISTLVARSGLVKDLVIIGGMSKNPAIIKWVESDLKVSSLAPKRDWDPSLTVAYGAALYADSFIRGQHTS